MNNDLPLVTIVIPTYNSSHYILSTLKELESQKSENYEIVIVNDGSRDNTIELLEREARINPRINIVNKDNGGVSSARNAGIMAAKGEFISFLDDDDNLSPDFLIKMYSRQKETNADAIYCGFNGYYGKDPVKYKNIPSDFLEGSLLINFLNKEVKFHIGCLFIKKKFIEENNLFFDEDIRIGEDLHYIYRLLSLCFIYSVSHFLYKHNYREASLMNKKRVLEHYQHEAAAHKKIYLSIMDIYKCENRDVVLAKLGRNMVYHKIRYLWRVLLSGDYKLLEKLMADNNVEFNNDKYLSMLDSKSKRRAKILGSNNKFIWRTVRLVNKNK